MARGGWHALGVRGRHLDAEALLRQRSLLDKPQGLPSCISWAEVLGLGSVQCNGHARVMSHAELLYQQILFLGALRPALLHEPVSIYRVKACWGMLSPARVLRQQSLLFKP